MPVTKDEVEKVLFHEARLLANGELDTWLSMYTDDAIYWIPANHDDIDPMRHVSLVYDDKERMQERIWSIQSGVRWAQDPRSRIRHFISNVEIEEEGDDEVTVSSSYALFEIRRAVYGDRYFVGRCEHRLRKVAGEWKIAHKKIELLNNDAPIENLTFIM